MIDSDKLKKIIADSKLTQKELASDLKMSQSTLNLKINNRRPLFLNEAQELQKLLNLNNDNFCNIFLK